MTETMTDKYGTQTLTHVDDQKSSDDQKSKTDTGTNLDERERSAADKPIGGARESEKRDTGESHLIVNLLDKPSADARVITYVPTRKESERKSEVIDSEAKSVKTSKYERAIFMCKEIEKEIDAGIMDRRQGSSSDKDESSDKIKRQIGELRRLLGKAERNKKKKKAQKLKDLKEELTKKLKRSQQIDSEEEREIDKQIEDIQKQVRSVTTDEKEVEEETKTIKAYDEKGELVGEFEIKAKLNKRMEKNEQIKVKFRVTDSGIDGNASIIGGPSAQAGPSREISTISTSIGKTSRSIDRKAEKPGKGDGTNKPRDRPEKNMESDKENKARKRKRDKSADKAATKKKKVVSKKGTIVDERLSRTAKARSLDQPRKEGKFDKRGEDVKALAGKNTNPRVRVLRLNDKEIERYRKKTTKQEKETSETTNTREKEILTNISVCELVSMVQEQLAKRTTEKKTTSTKETNITQKLPEEEEASTSETTDAAMEDKQLTEERKQSAIINGTDEWHRQQYSADQRHGDAARGMWRKDGHEPHSPIDSRSGDDDGRDNRRGGSRQTDVGSSGRGGQPRRRPQGSMKRTD